MTCFWNGAIFTAAFVLASGTWTIARAQVVQTAQRMAQGWVVSVQPLNGLGMFRIRTGAGNNNLVAGVNPARGAAMQQFIVGPATHFDAAVGGPGLVPASFGALRPGQRVMVQAQGQQAIGVRILPGNLGARTFPGNLYVGAMRRGHYGHLHGVPSTSAGNVSPLGSTTMPRTPRISQPVALNMNRNIHNFSATHAAAHTSSHKR